MKERQCLATVKEEFVHGKRHYITLLVEIGEEFADAELLPKTLTSNLGLKPSEVNRLDKLKVSFRQKARSNKYIVSKVHFRIPGRNL